MSAISWLHTPSGQAKQGEREVLPPLHSCPSPQIPYICTLPFSSRPTPAWERGFWDIHRYEGLLFSTILPRAWNSNRLISCESSDGIRFRHCIAGLQYKCLFSCQVQKEKKVRPVKIASSSKPGFNSTRTLKFQMFKLGLEKAPEPEIKLQTSFGSSKK